MTECQKSSISSVPQCTLAIAIFYSTFIYPGLCKFQEDRNLDLFPISSPTQYVWSIIGEGFIFKLKEHAHMRSCNVLHLLMCCTKHFSFFDCAGSLQDLLAVTCGIFFLIAACRTFSCGMWDLVL